MTEGIGWSVDAEVSGDFDSRDKTRLRDVRRQRVNDGSRLRLIGKGLRAGVMEEGVLTHPEPGVPQGGVRSPVLATILLHPGLDAWFEREGRPRMQGRCGLMRFADDFISGGEPEAEARKSMTGRPKRFARCGWRIPPTKTALSGCRQPAARKATGEKNGTCDFLGLTHSWTQSRQGYGVSKRRTARQRLRRLTKSRGRWWRPNRHAPLKNPYQRLCLKWRGHFRYDGMRGNFRLLEVISRYAERTWQYWPSSCWQALACPHPGSSPTSDWPCRVAQ